MSRTSATSRSATSSTSTFSPGVCASVSCTTAIAPTRRTASSSASRASGLSMRRACSRSSAATVCRLFFTRWWISRIVASLLSSARSRRRISVASRTSTSEPTWRPPRCSGTPRSVTTAPEFSTSAPPGRAAGGHRPRAPRRPARGAGPAWPQVRAKSTPTRSVASPSRWYAERALGLANSTRSRRRRAGRGRRRRAAASPCAPAAARAGTCRRRPSPRARRRPRGRTPPAGRWRGRESAECRSITPSSRPDADDRDGLDRRGTGDPAVGHDDAPGDGPVEQRAATAGGVLADDVVEQHGRAGRGAHLVGGDEAAAVPGRQPQHEVGEREVGEQRPVGDEAAQVVEVGLGQVGALARDVVEPGHAPTLGVRRPTVADRGTGSTRGTACARGSWPGQEGAAMRARRVDSAAEFLAATEAWRAADPVRTQRPRLGGAPASRQGRRYERELVVRSPRTTAPVVGAALWTAPYRLLARPRCRRRGRRRAGRDAAALGDARPGCRAAVAPRGVAERAGWATVGRDMRERILVLGGFVPPVGVPPGRSRRARRSTTSTSARAWTRRSSPSTPARSCPTPARSLAAPGLARQPVLGGRRRAGLDGRARPAGRRRRRATVAASGRSTRRAEHRRRGYGAAVTAAVVERPAAARRRRHAVHRRGQPDEQRRLRARSGSAWSARSSTSTSRRGPEHVAGPLHRARYPRVGWRP